MSNIIDYLKWRGDISFSQVSLNEIDSLILSRLSYFPFDNLIDENEQITIEEAYKRFIKNEKKGKILQEDDLDLFPLLAQSERFKNLNISDYINKLDKEQEKQFSAITIFLPNELIYVSFRGTDNTLIGWKEDFNMSFSSHVPSQKESVKYLNEITRKYNGDIIVGGHSKGGNLAVYASTFASENTKNRIREIYNEDGPGFDDDITCTEEYKTMITKVHTYIPQSSVIGRLLNHEEAYTVVQSVANGIMQHDLYSWQVLGSKFISLAEVTNGSQFVDETIKGWVKEVSPEQRAQFIDTVFEILSSTDASTLSELSSKKFTTAKVLFKNYQNIDNESKKLISKTVKALLEIVKQNVKKNLHSETISITETLKLEKNN